MIAVDNEEGAAVKSVLVFFLLIAPMRLGLPALGEAGEVQKEQGKVLCFDGFEGKLSLDWKIQNPEPSHYSLSKNPGALTITTQQGGFGETGKSYKNLFLTDCPVAAGMDLQMTTCLSSFRPVAVWNQAGLIFYNDDNNYLTFVHQWWDPWAGDPLGRGGGPVFHVGFKGQRGLSDTFFRSDREFEKLWLRMTKRGNRYEFSTSFDGKSFAVRGPYLWGDGTAKHVGFFALNDVGSKAPEIDASFDFFEVRAVPAKPPPKAGAGYVIPGENLKIPEEMQACTRNFPTIHAAIVKYDKDRGKLPDWLSDLVPDYLSADALLCPQDPEHKSHVNPDPNLPCSYYYDFHPDPISDWWDVRGLTSARDWKRRQQKLFGDVVPLVSCWHHGGWHPNVSVGGHIYYSQPAYEWLFNPHYRFGDELRVKQPSGAKGAVSDEAE